MYACSHTKPNLSVWNCTRECDASTVWAIKKLTFYAIRWLWVRVCCAYGYGRAIHRYECRHRIGPFVPSKMAVYACSCLAIWFKTFAGSGMNVDCTESRNLPLRLSWLNNGVAQRWLREYHDCEYNGYRYRRTMTVDMGVRVGTDVNLYEIYHSWKYKAIDLLELA